LRLSDHISAKQITVEAVSKKKKPALEELLGILVKLKKINLKSKTKILSALLARERLGSTAIGQNIAIPHARIDEVKKSLIVIGLFKQGLDFDSLDGELVYIIFLILSPKELEGFHLKMLANISKLLRDKLFLDRLKKAKSSEQIKELIEIQEGKP
jgi:mannitol/fructose-specific phosphotransferase system IIA component (Ntr-type)